MKAGVILLLVLSCGLAKAQNRRPRPDRVGPDGKPGLPLPAAVFPSELARTRIVPDSMQLKKLLHTPSDKPIPGFNLPAMRFPNEGARPNPFYPSLDSLPREIKNR